MKNSIRLLFLLILFCIYTPHTLAYVGPVVPGQALWCITKRIGSTLDIIESKLCNGSFDLSILSPPLCSKIEIITGISEETVSKLSVATDELDLLTACAATAIMSPTTITSSGIYCVANPITGEIAIQADDVVVDLNNYVVTGDVSIAAGQTRITIKNGVIDNDNAQGNALIANAGATDISVQNVVAKNALVGINFDQVIGGLIEGCTLTHNTTGVQLMESHKIVFESCIADCNLNAGFDLLSSTTNCFIDCKALSTGQSNNQLAGQICGFVSADGYGNIFERCIANSTQGLSTTGFNSLIAGFALRGSEGCSKIIECESANATSDPQGVAVPNGILLESTINSPITFVTQQSGSTALNAPEATRWSPDGKYVAVPDSSNSVLVIYAFDYENQTLREFTVATGSHQLSEPRDVSWRSDGSYLAVTDTGLDAVLIYEFCATSQTLREIAYQNGPTSLFNADDIDWNPNQDFIVVSDNAGSQGILVYEFMVIDNTLTEVAVQFVSGGSIHSGSWSPDGNYIAVADSGTVDKIIVYQFDSATNSINQVVMQTGINTPTITHWSPDGNYIAVVSEATPALLIYQFDKVNHTLTYIATSNTTPFLVPFDAQWSADGRFVVTVDLISGPITVYEFDPGAHTLIEVSTSSGLSLSNPFAIAWSPDGRYISTPDQGLKKVAVFSGLRFPSKNIIKGNTIYCNSGGSIPSGIGISGSSIANLIIQNTAYSNPLMPYMVDQSYVFATNVFNSSFGEGPTGLQNIAIGCNQPVCMPIDVALIMKQSNYKLSVAESSLDELESVVDNLMISSGSPCDPISITTSPTTLTGPGIYCIANSMITGLITIDGSDVQLDLNNYTITGGIEVTASKDRITIQHGVVSNAESDAIKINSGCTDITIKDVVAKNSLIGISCDQVANGLIKGCTFTQNTTGAQLIESHKIVFESCIADCNFNVGFDLLSSTTNYFTDCKTLSTGQGNTSVINNTVIGFSASNGKGNIFERCIANSTQALSTTDSASIVAGFALRGTEACSKIIECESANATTSVDGVTVPYGILLEATFDGLTAVTSVNPGDAEENDNVNTISWSPDGHYLAVGGSINSSTGDDLYIYYFDRISQTLQQVDSVNPGGGTQSDTVLTVAWSHDGHYLAVGGSINSSTGDDLYIYSFDRISQTLQQVDSVNPGEGTQADDVYTVAWSPDGKYLAMGGRFINSSTADNLYLYYFDRISQTLQQVDSVNPGGGTQGDQVFTVAWAPDGKYLAVGGSINGSTGDDLYLYYFDRGTQKLQQVDSVNPGGGTQADQVSTVAWSPDGQYLAIGGSIAGYSNDDLYLYYFDRGTQKLQQVDSVNPGGGAVSDVVAAVAWSPDGQYLAMTGGINYPALENVYLYYFDRGLQKLQQVDSINPGGGTIDFMDTIAWSPDGQYLAMGGHINYPNYKDACWIYQVLTFPHKNVIKGNTVYCNSGARYPSGVGISGSSIANLIIQNTAYSNPLMPIYGECKLLFCYQRIQSTCWPRTEFAAKYFYRM